MHHARPSEDGATASHRYGEWFVKPVRRLMICGWSALAGRCRGGTGGRSSLIEGRCQTDIRGLSTSRPCIRRGSPSKDGRHRPGPAAHGGNASPRATRPGLPVARARPGNVPGAIVGVFSVKGGGLPEERGELARDGDRHHAGGLAAPEAQVRPALIEAPLGAPGDSDHARVLAFLATCELDADRRLEAVVVGGLDQQATGVGGPGPGDRALAADRIGGALGGHDREKARQQVRSREALRGNGRTPGESSRISRVSVRRASISSISIKSRWIGRRPQRRRCFGPWARRWASRAVVFRHCSACGGRDVVPRPRENEHQVAAKQRNRAVARTEENRAPPHEAEVSFLVLLSHQRITLARSRRPVRASGRRARGRAPSSGRIS